MLRIHSTVQYSTCTVKYSTVQQELAAVPHVTRSCFSNVEEKPSSAGSRKEKERELKSPVGELVEVKTSGYSKK